MRGLLTLISLTVLVFSPSLGFGALSPDCLSLLEKISRQILHADRPAKERRQMVSLMKEIRDIIKAHGDHEKLSKFLEVVSTLDPQKIEKALITVSKMNETAKTGAFWRPLLLDGNEDGIKSFISLLAHGKRSLDEINYPKLTGSFAESEATKALAQFRADPIPALDHIWNGDIRMDTQNSKMPVIAFGLHSIEAFQSFLRLRAEHRFGQSPKGIAVMNNALDFLTEQLVQPTNRKPPPEIYLEIDEMGQVLKSLGMGTELLKLEKERIESLDWNTNTIHMRREQLLEWGFDVSPKNMLPFSLHLDDHIGLHATKNGVIRVRFPRNSFRSKAWEQSILAAESGLVPIGGKTLFPKGWTRDQIKSAIEGVLSSPNSIFLPGGNSAGKFYYIVGNFGDIRLAVGVSGGKVATAFPTWRQYMPKDTNELYGEFEQTRDRLNARIHELHYAQGFSRKVTIEDLCHLYLGKEKEIQGLSEADLAVLKSLVNPADWTQIPMQVVQGAAPSKYMHGAISEFLQAQSLVNQIERIGFPD